MKRSGIADTRGQGAACSDRGAVAVYVALLVPVMFIFAAFAVDTSRWYVEQQRLQKAADAAALAGAPFMPDDLGPGSKAVAAAQAAGLRNGYAILASDIQEGGRSSQLKVTARSTVQNSFASLIGIATTNLYRTAVGEFTGPAPMGSPCNTLGNEPPSSTAPASVQPASPFATCPGGTNQPGKHWLGVYGPQQSKVHGDRFMTLNCTTNASDSDGCAGSTSPRNTDYYSRGYYGVITVPPSAVNDTITVQLYDPTWVDVGGDCSGLPTGTGPYPVVNNMNPFAPDAVSRYQRARSSPFCSGDQDPSGTGDGRGAAGRVDTSFALLKPNDQLNPTASREIKPACIKQFRGYDSGPTSKQLTASATGGDGYNQDLASVLNQWVTLCDFVPSALGLPDGGAGDYYLQYRTNVSLPASGGSSNTNGYAPGVYTGNTTVVTSEDGNTTSGRGSNAFAIRAYTGTGTNQIAGRLAVSSFQRMALVQNTPGGINPPVFNLIRVLPGAAGQSIVFTFFDVAEGSSSGSYVSVLPPLDVQGTLANDPVGSNPVNPLVVLSGSPVRTARNCTVSGVRNGSDVDCTLPISSTANNGRLQEIRVPIPQDYDCSDTSQGGCWFRLVVSFGPGQDVNDGTTWTAVLDGDPVRLEE